MSKLWDKGYQLNDQAEQFTVGDDYLVDHKLVQYDCLGSIAHAKMLHEIGVLTKEELSALQKELIEIATQEGFHIQIEEEDVHTAVENRLTLKLGDTGKKLHTARSRNDQVNVDVRLYMKHSLQTVLKELLNTADSLCQFAKKGEKCPIPGRTHMQLAMPSSLGLWAGCYLEALLDDASMLLDGYRLIDQSPLGSASSYGVSLPIDRQMTADLLGFKKVQNNVLYANQSRGKFEASIMHVLTHIMSDLSRLASDLIFFTLPEIAYLALPETLCPGSSLMPQKRNPCVLELIRAKATKVSGSLQQIFEIIRPLSSGYHRDLQETKKPMIESFETTAGALKIMNTLINGLKTDEKKCAEGFTAEVFATDRVLSLVKEGVAFRDAYKTVGASLENIESESALENILSKTHQGAPGNLNLELSEKQMSSLNNWLKQEENKWEKMVNHLFQEIIS